MKFDAPLQKGILIKRYKRFFADVDLNGQVVTAHVPNSGRMLGCSEPGSACYISFHDDPNRKLKYTLEIVKTSNTLVGVNTQTPNKIVAEAIEQRLIDSWKKFDLYRSEIKINEKSRLDFVLYNNDAPLDFKKYNFKKSSKKFHFVEVKNVTLAQGDQALFPDGVTTRGQKHLQDLMDLIDMGHTAEVLFTIQRNDVTTFTPATEIDLEYARLLRQAKDHGVIVTPLICTVSTNSISLSSKKLPIQFVSCDRL